MKRKQNKHYEKYIYIYHCIHYLPILVSIAIVFDLFMFIIILYYFSICVLFLCPQFSSVVAPLFSLLLLFLLLCCACPTQLIEQ